METLNYVAHSAAKAVWGEHHDGDDHPESHREPISGASGVVSRGEPYDAGNMDDEAQRRVERELSQHELENPQQILQETGTPTREQPLSSGEYIEATSTTSTTPTPASPSSDMRNIYPKPGSNNIPPAAPPRHDPYAPAKASGKALTKGFSRDEMNPELKGPGPRPLDQVAREHGGNAAAKDETPAQKQQQQQQKSQGSSEGGEQQAEGSSENEPGEQYVRTTGLAADGGDFDASKPGAGREADRLMEEKGMKHAEEEAKKAEGKGDSHGHGKGKDKDKPSLGERIKQKLHKHN